ncbi:MAG: hypothetical protein IKA31_01930, partial [Clostridia bacterium]|nr:hypothetical protein [Clostridia bacterium]
YGTSNSWTGVALYINGGDCTTRGYRYKFEMRDCIFTENRFEIGYNDSVQVIGNGGIIQIFYGCDCIISGCEFSNNVGMDNVGGGLRLYGDNSTKPLALPTAVIYDCDFLYNTAVRSQSALLVGTAASYEVYDCTFIGNSANANTCYLNALKDGNAIAHNLNIINNYSEDSSMVRVGANSNSFVHFYDCVVEGNRTKSRILETTSNALIENVKFSNNTGLNASVGLCYAVDNYRKILKNCTFEGNLNQHETNGGALYINVPGPFTLSDCDFLYNEAARAAAVYVSSNTKLTIKNCNFVGNKANGLLTSDGSYGGGGAVYVEGITLIENSSFVDNSCVRYGGAIYIASYTGAAFVTLVSSEFVNNSAGLVGGAIYVNGDLTIENDSLNDENATIFKDNYVNSSTNNTFGGALGVANDKNVIVNNAKFIGNYATASGEFTGYGGALGVASTSTGTSKIKIMRAEFSGNGSLTKNLGGAIYTNNDLTAQNIFGTGNKSTNGGVIYATNGTLNLTNLEFENSIASANGGTIYIGGKAKAEINNATFIGSQAVNGGAIYFTTTLTGNSILTMNVFDVNFSYGKATNGAGIYMTTDNVELRLRDAVLTGNFSTEHGAALYINGGNFYLSDAVITGNGVASGKEGAGFYALRGKDFNISRNLVITDNYAGGEFDNSTKTYIKGSSGKNANVYIATRALAIIDGLSTTSNVGVKTAVDNAAFGNSYKITTADFEKFVYDDNTKMLQLEFNGERSIIKAVPVNNMPNSITYVASDYYGGYDGEYHTIGIEVLNMDPSKYMITYGTSANGSDFLPDLVENKTKFARTLAADGETVETKTVYFKITSTDGSFMGVSGNAKVTITKQTVYVEQFPEVSDLTVSTSTYKATLANATISGGVAAYSDFEIAGHFEWVAPTTQTGTSIGYYYYDMKFVPENKQDFEEFVFTQLVYVGGYDKLFYKNANGYTGFYVHGNEVDDTITDAATAKVSTSLSGVIKLMNDGGVIYMISTYNCYEEYFQLTKNYTVTVKRHALNTTGPMICVYRAGVSYSHRFGNMGMPGKIIFDGNKINTNQPMIHIKTDSNTYCNIYFYPGVEYRNHNSNAAATGRTAAILAEGTCSINMYSMEMYNCHSGGDYAPFTYRNPYTNKAYTWAGTMTVRDCNIHNCTGYNGAAMSLGNLADTNFYGGTIQNNTALNNGGGLYVMDNVSINIYELNLLNNTALNNGGGAYFERLPNIYYLYAEGNTAANGGGIYTNEEYITGKTTLAGAKSYGGIVLRNNHAVGTKDGDGNVLTSGNGGGAYFNKLFMLTYAVITGNTSTGMGA